PRPCRGCPSDADGRALDPRRAEPTATCAEVLNHATGNALARGPFAANPDLGYNPTMRCVRAPLSAVRRRRQSERQAQLMRSSDVSEQAKPTIVFAHGLWADGSCYSKVIPRLLADGFQVISTQNHLNTVADDAAAVRTSFARARGPVVLVGHSYG